MSILEQVYAQGGDVILHTLEIDSVPWTEGPIVLVRDYQDHIITTEDDRELTAVACGITVALPKRDASGAQSLTFALDGVRPQATQLLRLSRDAGAPVRVTYRPYLYSDLSEPADQPFYFIARKFNAASNHVEITAGLFDLIDMRWPRIVYDSNTAPGLKYIS